MHTVKDKYFILRLQIVSVQLNVRDRFLLKCFEPKKKKKYIMCSIFDKVYNQTFKPTNQTNTTKKEEVVSTKNTPLTKAAEQGYIIFHQ